MMNVRIDRSLIRSVGGSTRYLLALCDTLEREAAEFGRRMDLMAMKRHHHASYRTLMSRDAEGKARRSGR